MYKIDIIKLVEQFAIESADKLYHYELVENKLDFNTNINNDFENFVNATKDIGDYANYIFDVSFLSNGSFINLLKDLSYPIVAFNRQTKYLQPVIIKPKSKKVYEVLVFENGNFTANKFKYAEEVASSLKSFSDLNAENKCNLIYSNIDVQPQLSDIVFLTGYKISANIGSDGKSEPLKPTQRFYNLLKAEARDVKYIYFFALMIALVSLTLPLGIQAIIGLISGGLLLESVVVLMFLVVVATVASGWLQVQQLSMVEIMQQRIFTKTALEFAFKIPRIKAESLIKEYAPELINRFFDIINIQKSLPKFLIDFTSAIIQIFAGLLLLSFYHPLFILFSLLVLAILAIIFYTTGKAALESNLKESTYKYKVAYWLEELGRSILAFKLAGNSNLPLQKTDMLLEGYLQYRKKHFKILVKQYASIIAFKTIVTAGLLIMGGLLVINKQINLGQFVAAEIIILLIISSVEKLISTVAVIYDMLTSLDKIGKVLDMPQELNAGRDINHLNLNNELYLSCSNLTFKYPDSKSESIRNIDLTVKANQKICIAGKSDAGKSTLLKVIAGVYTNFDGVITLNKVSVKELNIKSYRSVIGDNFYTDNIFEGSIFDNIAIGRNGISLQHVVDACEKVGLTHFTNNLTEGLRTKVYPGASNLPTNIARKLLMARSLAGNSKLILFDDLFSSAAFYDDNEIIDTIFSINTAIIVASNMPQIMKKCDVIYLLNKGKVEAKGTYAELLEKGLINKNDY